MSHGEAIATAAPLPRPASVCDTWSELQLCSKASESLTPSAAISACHSVLMAPGLVTPEECVALASAGQRVRPATSPETLVRLCLDDGDIMFSPEERRCAAAIVRRALGFIEATLPALAVELFGRVDLREMELLYACNEPAINIYDVGGEFKPHRDKHSLSVLVPLTSPDAFSGGGTAFWAEEQCAGRRVRRGCETPSLLLKPEPGTMMFFCGELVRSRASNPCSQHQPAPVRRLLDCAMALWKLRFRSHPPHCTHLRIRPRRPGSDCEGSTLECTACPPTDAWRVACDGGHPRGACRVPLRGILSLRRGARRLAKKSCCH